MQMNLFGKSFFWLLVTTFFGLLQLWIIIGLSNLLKDYDISYSQILIDGPFLFFTSAMAASITTDYHFGENKISSNFFSGFLFVFFPVVILVTCIVLFVGCYGKHVGQIDINFLRNVEFALLFMTLVYALISKIIFYNLNNET